METEKFETLLVESDLKFESPFKSSLVTALGEKYEESIEKFLKNIRKEDLIHLTIEEIKSYGFTLSIAKKLLGILQFALSLQKVPSSNGKVTICSPIDAVSYLSYLQYETQEHVVVLFLSAKNQVMARKTLFIGSFESTTVHPREIIKEVIKISCASIIIAHNHPTGNASPSKKDLDFNDRLVSACEIMGIRYSDHIIIGDGNYISLKEKGYM